MSKPWLARRSMLLACAHSQLLQHVILQHKGSKIILDTFQNAAVCHCCGGASDLGQKQRSEPSAGDAVVESLCNAGVALTLQWRQPRLSNCTSAPSPSSVGLFVWRIIQRQSNSAAIPAGVSVYLVVRRPSCSHWSYMVSQAFWSLGQVLTRWLPPAQPAPAAAPPRGSGADLRPGVEAGLHECIRFAARSPSQSTSRPAPPAPPVAPPQDGGASPAISNDGARTAIAMCRYRVHFAGDARTSNSTSSPVCRATCTELRLLGGNWKLS